tara:strand:+ start:14 stop:406 length:393 start_codon:yes stop_codon:yes gene_type:complete
MKTISLAQFVGSLIDEYGFNASDIAREAFAREALTHETNTVVESPVDSPVKVTATRKKDRTPRISRGALQPGGEVFELIQRTFFQFDRFTTISDVAKASGQTPARCGTVATYLIKKGRLRRDGRRLNILA